MEYYEDRFQQEQDALCDYAQYFTLMICGVEMAQGSYEDCEGEMEHLMQEYQGLNRSDCKITHHCVRI